MTNERGIQQQERLTAFDGGPRLAIRNKTILITGGAGFIGSSLAERLVQNNEIILFDRSFHNQPVTYSPLDSHSSVQKVKGDIRDEKALKAIAMEADIVIHAAAIVGVERVCCCPRETLETNFVGTLNILRALEKNSKLGHFVYLSTSEIFGTNSAPLNEGTATAIGPASEARWSYAISKLSSEHLLKAYRREVGIPTITVRPFNIFGPRRLGSHAILNFVLNALRQRPIQITGQGSQIRSWCFIDDFCDAVIEMLTRPEAIGEDFNIGNPENTVTILELARMVLDLTGRTVSINFIESPWADINSRIPSSDKACKILGFRPRHGLRPALKITADWYAEYQKKFDDKLESLIPA